jgi:hypothetical protein
VPRFTSRIGDAALSSRALTCRSQVPGCAPADQQYRGTPPEIRGRRGRAITGTCATRLEEPWNSRARQGNGHSVLCHPRTASPRIRDFVAARPLERNRSPHFDRRGGAGLCIPRFERRFRSSRWAYGLKGQDRPMYFPPPASNFYVEERRRPSYRQRSGPPAERRPLFCWEPRTTSATANRTGGVRDLFGNEVGYPGDPPREMNQGSPPALSWCVLTT